jgi:hypothetical protein
LPGYHNRRFKGKDRVADRAKAREEYNNYMLNNLHPETIASLKIVNAGPLDDKQKHLVEAASRLLIMLDTNTPAFVEWRTSDQLCLMWSRDEITTLWLMYEYAIDSDDIEIYMSWINAHECFFGPIMMNTFEAVWLAKSKIRKLRL